jgi:hypothetical protein
VGERDGETERGSKNLTYPYLLIQRERERERERERSYSKLLILLFLCHNNLGINQKCLRSSHPESNLLHLHFLPPILALQVVPQV